MDLWQWVLVYAVLLAGLQLLVYAYVRRRGGDQSIALAADGEGGGHDNPVPGHSVYRRAPASGEDADASAGDMSDRAHDVDGEETLRCPHCGTRNVREPVYTYCRNCVSQLGL